MGDDDTLAWRGSLLFEPDDDLSISLSANFAKTDVATGPYQSKPTIGVYNAAGELVNVIDTPPVKRGAVSQPTARISDRTRTTTGYRMTFFNNATGAFGPDGIVDVGRFGAGTDFFGYLDPDGEDFLTSGDFAFADSGFTDTWGLNGRVEYQLTDSMMLTLVTDHKDYEKLLFIDVDSAPVNQLANYAGVDATSFTQEVRLTGQTENSNWVLGLYYLNIDTDSDNGLKISPNGVAGRSP